MQGGLEVLYLNYLSVKIRSKNGLSAFLWVFKVSTKKGKNPLVLACTQTLFYFSFCFFQKHLQATRARENESGARETKIFFSTDPYPFALTVNKSPAVYILSPAFYGLWRESKGSVNRLLCSLHLWNAMTLARWWNSTCPRLWFFASDSIMSCFSMHDSFHCINQEY